MDTTARIREMLVEDYPEARGESQRFAEVGMDSLDYLGFLHRVEDEFDVELPKGSTPDDVAELAGLIEAALAEPR
jgi:acyl carrier protein